MSIDRILVVIDKWLKFKFEGSSVGYSWIENQIKVSDSLTVDKTSSKEAGCGFGCISSFLTFSVYVI